MPFWGHLTHPVGTGSLCQGFTQRSDTVIWRQNGQAKKILVQPAALAIHTLCISTKEKLLKENSEGAWS